MALFALSLAAPQFGFRRFGAPIGLGGYGGRFIGRPFYGRGFYPGGFYPGGFYGPISGGFYGKNDNFTLANGFPFVYSFISLIMIFSFTFFTG